MSRLVLHIGTGKTGTTFFQSLLNQNVDRLGALGISYPTISKNNHHVEFWLAADAPGTPMKRFGIACDADLQRLRANLAVELKRMAVQHPVSIISTENLSVDFGPEPIERLRTMLLAAYDEVDILMFVRRQDHYIPSWYSTAMTLGFPDPQSPALIEQFGDTFRPYQVAELWRGAFGSDHVIVRPFLERFKADPTAVCAQGLEVMLGVSRHDALTELKSWDVPKELENVSLSGKAAEALRVLNPYAPMSKFDGTSNHEQRRYLMEGLSERLPGRPLQLTPQFLAAIQAELFAENELLLASVPESSDWEEWRDQPLANSGPVDAPTAEEFASVIAELSAPRGWFVWGGPLPDPPLTPSQKAVKRARRVAGRVKRTLLRTGGK